VLEKIPHIECQKQCQKDHSGKGNSEKQHTGLSSVIPTVLKGGRWRQQRKSERCHVRRTQPTLSSDGGWGEVQSQRRQSLEVKIGKNQFPSTASRKDIVLQTL